MILDYYHREFQNTSAFIGGSKSESNRALLIAAYGNLNCEIANLSESDDTKLLTKNLKQIEATNFDFKNPVSIYCANAATIARFLLTYLANKQGKWILYGDARLHQRPIAPLVDALRELDVVIEYQEQEGYLPVLISGRKILGGAIQIDARLSSQYVSSLLLAAPTFENGLKLKLNDHTSSIPYIDMTIKMMEHFQICVERKENEITIPKSVYQNRNFYVGSDWSSASYWYELVALTENSNLLLEDLQLDSMQGDAVLATLFESFGVTSEQRKEGVFIEKKQKPDNSFSFDFRNYPDLFPAVAATCAGLGLTACFSGLDNLFAKETDRRKAMQTELLKINPLINSSKTEIYVAENNDLPCFLEENPLKFETYNDHRIAMSLTPLSLKIGAIKIQSPEVVSKSYPQFWQQLARVFEK
jgi:3-phosphoshikimate 1-carboxyvinyltransferase